MSKQHVLVLGLAISVVSLSVAGNNARVATAKAPTFDHDVAPIVFDKCSGCHHPGQVAPFALLTFADFKNRGPLIDQVTQSKVMPPWKAFGDCAFKGDRSLTATELATIHAWVQTGMPQGKAQDLPPTPQYAGGWLMGQPDLIVKMPKPFHIPADGPDIYRNFVLPLNLPADTYVRAIDFEPGNRRVVHHSLFFYDATGSARKRDGEDGQPGFTAAMGGFSAAGQRAGGNASGSLGGWAVGAQPFALPDGLAYEVPAGADLILSTHFHPTGKPEEEASTVGLYFAKQPPDKRFMGVQLPPVFGYLSGIDIPAGDKSYTVEDSFTLPIDVNAFGSTAHAHYLARQITLDATLPSGKMLHLLNIPDWDFNWQDQYIYQHDVLLPKGTVLHSKLVYDNSSANPRNPSDPPKEVKWGEQTTDEMGMAMLRVTAANRGELPILAAAVRKHLVATYMADQARKKRP